MARDGIPAPPLDLLRAPRREGGYVLVVDDDAATRSGLTRLLEQDGFEVASASDGVKAMLSVEARVPDAIITDEWMPGGDGRFLLVAMRQRFPDVPVIIMSARHQSASELAEIGALAYLTKPLHMDDVIAVLDVATQLHAARRSALQAS